jgi:hypothetical protein
MLTKGIKDPSDYIAIDGKKGLETFLIKNKLINK